MTLLKRMREPVEARIKLVDNKDVCPIEWFKAWKEKIICKDFGYNKV
jgi:hypothetical protein